MLFENESRFLITIQTIAPLETGQPACEGKPLELTSTFSFWSSSLYMWIYVLMTWLLGICIYSSLSVLMEKEKMLLFFELARNTQTLSCSLSDVSWFKLYRRPQERRGSHWVCFPPWANLHLSESSRQGRRQWLGWPGRSLSCKF